MAKVKIKAGFRYDVETIITNVDCDWKEKLDMYRDKTMQDIKKEIDFMFCEYNEGVMSDWTLEMEEVSE